MRSSLDTSGLPALLSQGEAVTYVSDGTTLTATAGARTVFTLTVNPDGSWSFDLEDQLDHVLDSGDAGTLLQTTGGAGGRDRLLGADHRHRL